MSGISAGNRIYPKDSRSRKRSFCGEDNLHTPLATECYLYPIGTNPKCCGGRNRTSVKGLMRPLGEPTHSPLFQRTKILAGVEESNLFYGPQPRMRFIPQREIPTTLLCCKSNLAIRLHFKEPLCDGPDSNRQGFRTSALIRFLFNVRFRLPDYSFLHLFS